MPDALLDPQPGQGESVKTDAVMGAMGEPVSILIPPATCSVGTVRNRRRIAENGVRMERESVGLRRTRRQF
jgi:hypothetical protein